MAEVTRALTTENQSITNYDYSQLFLTNFKTVRGTIAASGADIDLEIGQIIGRIAATGKLAISKSASNDGSEIPLGICLKEGTVEDGDELEFAIAVTGKVDASKLVFNGTDTVDTEVTSQNRTFGDLIPASTEGIELENVEQLSNYDNQ